MTPLQYLPCTKEFCRDLVQRAHGKFSAGSASQFHRFAVEVMLDSYSADFRVWELEHKGFGYNYRIENGVRMRTVAPLDLSELDPNKIPVFASQFCNFLKEVRNLRVNPRYIHMQVKLDFEGKIWNTPKVYVNNITFSAYSLSDICEPEEANYLQGVFGFCFKDFYRMQS